MRTSTYAPLINARGRLYDPKTRNFLSPDPIIAFPFAVNGWNRYTFALNSPFFFRDFSGLDPVAVYIRSFAPWPRFGLGFGGDGRGFSVSTNTATTSRISARFIFDPSTGEASDVGVFSDPSHFGVAGAPYGFGFALEDTGDPRASVSATGDAVIASITGSNPLVPLSPDIDATANFVFGGGADRLTVDVDLVGDAFPNAEVFLQDPTLNSVFVAGFETSGGRDSEPFTMLPFSFDRPMGGGDVTILLDQNGSFVGVQGNNMSMTIGVWNDLSAVEQ